MKSILFSCLFLPLLAWFQPSNSQESLSDEIGKALGSGDVETLYKHFDAQVELAILDQEDLYQREEAKRLVADFFYKHKPKSFAVVHQGISKSQDSRYLIGNLSVANGQFRVYVYTKVSASKTLIQELRFTRE